MPWDRHNFDSITIDSSNLTDVKTFAANTEKNPIIQCSGLFLGIDTTETPQILVEYSVDGTNYETLELINLATIGSDNSNGTFNKVVDLSTDSTSGRAPFLKLTLRTAATVESGESVVTTNYSLAFWVDGDDPNSGAFLTSSV